VDASNADIAALLGAKIVLVANGGLGNSFDELELNRTMCQKKGVEIAGVIINKVRLDKYDQTKHYLEKALDKKWGQGIPLLGCIPDRPFLGYPALADLERLFDATFAAGSQHRLRHYRLQDLTLVTTSLEVFLKNLHKNRLAKQRTLYVCHSSMNEILLGYLMECLLRNNRRLQHGHSSTTTTLSTETNSDSENFETAMIVTGCEDHPISVEVLDIMKGLPDSVPPVLMTDIRTDVVMQGIYQYTPKLNHEDSNRVERAVQHYQPYIDFDLLLERVTINDTVVLSAK
jgi:phosphate acetyltransferase